MQGGVALDEKGFGETGADLTREALVAARWPLERAPHPLERAPHPLETSLPGVFAVGDVRSRSVERVASATREGAMAVSFVHQVLRG